MQSSSPLALRVGIFATIGLIVLLFMSISVREVPWGAKTYEVTAVFRQTLGLEQGSKVTLRGVQVGQISRLEWDPEKLGVRAVFRVGQQYRIPDNAYAVVRSPSVLGGALVDIDFEDPAAGATVAYLADGKEMTTKAARSVDDAISRISEFGEEGTKLFKDLNANQKDIADKVNLILDENRENLKKTTDAFAEAGPKLNSLAERLDKMTASMEAGEGTMGALFKSRELYDNLNKFSANATDISDQIKSGKGTIGKLVYEDGIATKAETAFANLGKTTDTVNQILGDNREGLQSFFDSLGKVGPKLESAMTNFEQISAKVNKGEGTLGKLVNDPSLYDDARKAVNQVAESFEGAEEQGVVRSFFALIFGALV